MSYKFKIDGEDYIAVKNNIYFDKDDKEFAVILFDIEEKYQQDIINNKKNIKIQLTTGLILCHFILDIGVYKFAFELFDEPDIKTIRHMINKKEIEICIAFKKNNVLLEDLSFTIDY